MMIMKKGLFVPGVIGCLLLVVSLAGCGQQTDTAATPAPVAAGSAVAISGTTAVGITTLGLRTFSTALGTAEVKIGYCSTGSDEVIELGSGTTSPDGTYEVRVLAASLESLKATSGYVTNLMVTISKGDEIIGCVIPSISPEAGSRGYAPTASKGDYKKAVIARSAFKKGEDPKSFDYCGNIDKKFLSESLKDYDASKIDAVADSVKGAEDAMEEIIAGLGISAATLEAMKKKGNELHRTYIEPIMQAAFAAKTPPDRATIDAAFASMEAAMTTYALGLGISGQQIADLKSMKDKQFETKMGEESALTGDAAFTESKLRMSGDKMINLFLGQWDAANTLATTAPSGEVTFAVSNEATYTSFTASKESIKAHLLALQATAGTDPGAIPTYLRTAFFDKFIFPPGNADKPAPPTGTSEAEIAAARTSMEAFMNEYSGTRILMYFMSVFLTENDRDTFFRTTQPAMQAVFQTRFTDTSNSSGYYMGPGFWATNPSADTIQTRLAAFNTALGAAIDNSTTRAIIQTHAGFTASQTDAVLTAFRILMAPPDAM